MKKLIQDWNDGWPVALMAFFIGGVGTGLAAFLTAMMAGDSWSYAARFGLIAILLGITMPVLMHRALGSWYRARAFEAMVAEKEAERVADAAAHRR